MAAIALLPERTGGDGQAERGREEERDDAEPREVRGDGEPGRVRGGRGGAQPDAGERAGPEREGDGAVQGGPPATVQIIRPARNARMPANAAWRRRAGSRARSDDPRRAPTKTPTTTGAATSAFTSPRAQ